MPAREDARDLDHWVHLRRPTRVPDGMGGSATVDELIESTWAGVRPMRGGERFFASQLEANSSYEVKLRQRSDLTEADVIDDAEVGRLKINLIKRDPRAAFVYLECSLLATSTPVGDNDA